MAGIMPYVALSWLGWIGVGLLLQITLQWKNVLPIFVRNGFEYGKLRMGHKADKGWSLNPSVPKRWFTHFYLWGVLWNYCIFLYYTSHCILKSPMPLLNSLMEAVIGDYVSSKCGEGLSKNHFEVWLVLFLICVQVTRRLYESLFVMVFSDAKMSIVHYLLGVYFYTSVGLTAMLHLDSNTPPPTSTTHTTSLPLLIRAHFHWYHILCILVFLWASKHQYNCHRIFANLRPVKSDTKYGLPKGDWFEYVSSPHFFAEMVIYFALSMCQAVTNPLVPMWLAFVSTTVDLSLVARQTHQWYKEKFEDYPKDRQIIVPFVY